MVSQCVKLNVGCGKTAPPGWVNIDKAPSVFLSRWPGVRRVLRAVRVLSDGQAEGLPTGVVHADVTRRIPAEDSSVDFVYGAHMIEHLSRWQALAFASECRRVLRSGGILRVATPDLEAMIRDYVEDSSPFRGEYSSRGDAFCAEYNAYQDQPVNVLQFFLRRVFSGDSHQWMYDFESLEACLLEARLLEAGFATVRRCAYLEGNTPDLQSVEHRQRSVFVEAS